MVLANLKKRPLIRDVRWPDACGSGGMQGACRSARWRAGRRGPTTPGAGPAGSGDETRTAESSAAIAAELRVSEQSVRR